jgi:hypothetical protein
LSTELKPIENDRSEKTSVLLERVRAELPKDVTTVNIILTRLGQRSFGGILILFAGLGLIPGVSVVVGMIVLVLGIQMLSGFKTPLLPKFLTSKQIKAKRVYKVLGECIKYVVFIEKWVRPRWTFMANPLFTFILGLVITVLGFVMLLPLPFSNLPPAIAIIILSMGQLERDGLMIFIGMICSIAAFSIGFIFAGVALHSIQQFFS